LLFFYTDNNTYQTNETESSEVDTEYTGAEDVENTIERERHAELDNVLDQHFPSAPRPSSSEIADKKERIEKWLESLSGAIIEGESRHSSDLEQSSSQPPLGEIAHQPENEGKEEIVPQKQDNVPQDQNLEEEEEELSELDIDIDMDI
jgi:hypothetical protein